MPLFLTNAPVYEESFNIGCQKMDKNEKFLEKMNILVLYIISCYKNTLI